MNIPNFLTVLRIIMIPLFVVVYLAEGINNWFALIIFVAAAITDFLDGYIARKKNIVSDFGKLMDPLADKLMVMSAFVCFVAGGLLHPVVTIIILSREFLVTGFRSLATAKGKVIGADLLGKVKTISQDITIILVLLKSAATIPTESVLGFVINVFIWIMTVLTIVSAVNYCIKNKEIFSK